MTGCEAPTFVRLSKLVGDCEASNCAASSTDASGDQDTIGVKLDTARAEGSVESRADAGTADLTSSDRPGNDVSTGGDGGESEDAMAQPDAAASDDGASSHDGWTSSDRVVAPSIDAVAPAPSDAVVAPSIDAVAPAPSDGSLAGERPIAASNHCSVSGGAKVMLTFQNNLADKTVLFNWVNNSCAEVNFAKVGPRLTYRVSTFADHYWRARDSSSGALLKELVIAAIPAAQDASVP